MASIQIYFEGAKFFPHKEGAEVQDPKGPTAGVAFLGRGQRAHSPPARGSGERCKLPQRGPAENLKLMQLETSKFTTEIPYYQYWQLQIKQHAATGIEHKCTQESHPSRVYSKFVLVF